MVRRNTPAAASKRGTSQVLPPAVGFPIFQTRYKSKVVSDQWATSLSLPVTQPNFPAGELGPATARLAMELWETAVRLEISVALVRSLPTMFQMRDRVSDRVHCAIETFLPELRPLKSVLDDVATHFPFAKDIDPLDPRFPDSDFRSITMAIPIVVDRDATTLESCGAIPTLRTKDDTSLQYWAGIDFEIPPRPLPGAPRTAVSISHPFHPVYHFRVAQEAGRFRIRLERSPHATLRDLNVLILPSSGPAGSGADNSVANPSPSSVPVATLAAPATSGIPRASADFNTVHWYGTDYFFTPKQRKIVEVLWEAAEEHTPALSQEEIFEQAGFGAKKGNTLRQIFRGNPAWQTMIKGVPYRKGVYALQVPPGHVFRACT